MLSDEEETAFFFEDYSTTVIDDDTLSLLVSILKEIIDCVTYIKIPYDTLMNIPVFRRKQIILIHNENVNKENKNVETTTTTDMMVNSFAKMSM